MNPLLKKERDHIKFNMNELSLHIYGSRERLETLRRVSEIIANDPVLKPDLNFHHYSREEQMIRAIKNFNRFSSLFDVNDEFITKLNALLSVSRTVLGLHLVMFIPTLKALADEKQLEKWLPLAENFKIIGCYAQTELGHGSDVQSLEMEASFDKKTDEFVLNSATTSASKFWPGDLGVLCNVALVNAILVIDGKRHGMQSFLVPIRDLTTHEPFPGVEVGDIGPKLGFHTVDNGFLKLTNYRIPRENLLMRYVKVNKNGELSQVGNPRAMYNTMMRTRVQLCEMRPFYLAIAGIISVRYSIVRQQFRDELNNERSIIEYQLQQNKVLGILADAYATIPLGQKMVKLYEENSKLVERKDFSKLNEMHIISSGAKALISYLNHAGITAARLACGGHGYSDYSGIPFLLKNDTAIITLEGENTILYLQVARFLQSQLKALRSGKALPQFVEYLRNAPEIARERCSAENESEMLSLETVRKILMVNSCYWVLESARKITEDQEAGRSSNQRSGVALYNSAHAHNIYYTFNNFFESLRKYHDEPLRDVQTKLCLLFGLKHIQDRPTGLIESGFLSAEQLKLVHSAKEALLSEIRRHAIGLVDAFVLSDDFLKSALGRYDGDVYNEFFRLASQTNPLKKESIGRGLEYIRSMRAKL